MSTVLPEIEFVDRSAQSIRYLEHGWPNTLCRWHAHEELELHLIVKTRGKAFLGDHIGDFGPGSLYLVGPGMPHNWVTCTSTEEPVKTRDMLVQFGEDTLLNAMKQFPELYELESLFKESYSGVEFIGFDTQHAMTQLLKIRDTRGLERLLSFLQFLLSLSQYPNRCTLSSAKISYKSCLHGRTRIGDAVDYIVNNYQKPLSVDDTANIVGMSKSSFSRNFFNATGNRFTEFVNQLRIGKACVLLLETEDKISSICFDVGFRNLANFNRQFIKIKGITPSIFRHCAKSGLTPDSHQQAARR